MLFRGGAGESLTAKQAFVAAEEQRRQEAAAAAAVSALCHDVVDVDACVVG